MAGAGDARFAHTGATEHGKGGGAVDANRASNGAARGQRRWTRGATIRVLLTKREAAQALGMSVRHFERHVQRRLRCVHSGQLTLYPLRDIERWADEEATVGGRGRKRVR
jgi:hypothetical protein